MGALTFKENAEILTLCGISQLIILASNGIKYRKKNTTGPNDPQSQMAADGGGGPACDI